MKQIFKIFAVAVAVIVTSCNTNDEASLRENSNDTSLSARGGMKTSTFQKTLTMFCKRITYCIKRKTFIQG